jgi:hypothetical protein
MLLSREAKGILQHSSYRKCVAMILQFLNRTQKAVVVILLVPFIRRIVSDA